jgi:dTDP-4-dehydrorhamnose 3,5-epimerase
VKVTPTAIPDVLRLAPVFHGDRRGVFLETWRAERYAGVGVTLPFVQDNHSCSVRHTLRGLHYQVDRPQGKLISVITGRVFDVAVDLRRRSPTFGRWVGALLTADTHEQLWIPPGFAHGFYVLSERADLVYKCTDYYVGELDRTLAWDDPELAIAWPLGEPAPPLLSDKDAKGLRLRDAPTYP